MRPIACLASLLLTSGTLVLARPALAPAADRVTLRGTVHDPAGQPVAGATVTTAGDSAHATTDAGGGFTLELEPGRHTLRVTHPDHPETTRRVAVATDPTTVNLALDPLPRHQGEIVVQAIRAGEKDPVTRSDIGPEEIDRVDHGQEMPFVLQQLPSITSYSDNGLATGYSYLYIRGIQQTRINLTFDGVPLNDPEESAVYFANFADFAGALGSIQVQRGIGASTVGAAAYGGSVNFASADIAARPGLRAAIGAGGYGARRAALVLESGRLPGGFALYGRFSAQDSDGFKEHASVRQRAFYFGASRVDAESLFRLSGFAGRERQQLAFLAAEPEVLATNLRFNALTPEERDDYGQEVVQAQYTRFLDARSSVAIQGYYNGASGWFRLWDDPVARTALLQYGLDGHALGTVLTYRQDRDRTSFTGGVHLGHFTRDHFQDVVGGGHTYDNNSTKPELGVFAKLGVDLGRWHLHGDAQVRHTRFRYRGDIDLGEVSWTFFNPKIGFRRELAPGLDLYASVGRAAREPARSDLFAGEDNASIRYDLEAVEPEKVVDLEAGIKLVRGGLTLATNLYAMEFRDEIALTGELSEIGLPLRRNVGESYRRGVEAEFACPLPAALSLRASANLNHSRIDAWTQTYDVYGEDGTYLETVSRVHRDVPPLLTPAFTGNLGFDWTPHARASLSLDGRWVSESHLDNTGSDALTAASWFNLDASGLVTLGHGLRLRLGVNNLLDDDDIRPSGYSYPFLVRGTGSDGATAADTLGGTPYYYVFATRNASVTLDFRL